VLVFDDADLDRLAKAYYMAAFRNTGQDCHAASRVYAAPDLADAVLDTIRSVAETIRVGDSFDPATTMGPLVSRSQQKRVGGIVARALSQSSAELVTGGQPLSERGFYYPPTVLANVRHGDEIVCEEIFGPVVTVATFDDEADAVCKANDVVYGLAASIWTRSIDRAMRVTKALKVGTVWVNGHGATVGEMPFGGTKESGFGRDLSLWALEQHSDLKHVAVAVEA
jgi:aminobutyraldehyde dehydrogenase